MSEMVSFVTAEKRTVYVRPAHILAIEPSDVLADDTDANGKPIKLSDVVVIAPGGTGDLMTARYEVRPGEARRLAAKINGEVPAGRKRGGADV